MNYELTIRSDEGINESQAEDIFEALGDDYDSADWNGADEINVDGRVCHRVAVAYIVTAIRRVYGWPGHTLQMSVSFT